jgi:hypothetical protein
MWLILKKTLYKLEMKGVIFNLLIDRRMTGIPIQVKVWLLASPLPPLSQHDFPIFLPLHIVAAYCVRSYKEVY